MRLFDRPDLLAEFLHRHAGSRIADLGCGADKVKDAVGVDQSRSSRADVIHDLDVFPWPFADAEFGAVVARHVVEHLEDLTRFMAEARRILKPGGEAFVVTPHFSDATSYIDPTHKHHFAAGTFATYCREPTPWFDLRTLFVEIPGRWRNIGYEAHVNRKDGGDHPVPRAMRRWEEKHCFTRRGGQVFAVLRLRS